MCRQNIMIGEPKAVQDFKEAVYGGYFEETRLLSCRATYGRAGVFIYLRSYDTIVAFIDLRTKTLYDILRSEYGYTATSAQHIAKFKREFKVYFDTVIRTSVLNNEIVSEVYR